jgi:hypothetical protein
VVVLAVVLEAALARERGRWPAALALGGAAAVGWLVWTVYQLTHGIAVNAEHLGPFQPLAIGSVAAALLAVFGGVRTGGGLLVAALAWVVSGRVLLASPIRLITLVVVGELLATLIGFLLSAPSADLEVRTSATRLFEQFLPLALFVGAVGLARVLEQRSTYNRRGR